MFGLWCAQIPTPACTATTLASQIYLDRVHAEAACKQLNKHDRQDWQKEFKWQVFSLADRMDTIMDAQYDAAQYSDVD